MTTNSTYATFPMCECPYCGAEWQHDDYYRIESGDDIECPKCERKIRVTNVDTCTTATLVAVTATGNPEIDCPHYLRKGDPGCWRCQLRPRTYAACDTKNVPGCPMKPKGDATP